MRIWKGDVLIADLEELERWTHRKSTQKRLNAKEVIFPKQGEFIFPTADGRIKNPGGDQDLRTSTLVRHRPIQGESNMDFLGESEGSLPQPQDSFPDAGDAINDFWEPRRWGPRGRPKTGGDGLARVPNLRVCEHPFHRWEWHTQGRKDELTSCRGTVQSAWQKPPEGRAGLPARVSGRHVVRGRQSSPTLEVRLGEQARLVKTVKIQVRWAAAQPGQDRRLPGVVTHSWLQPATSTRSRVGIVLEDGSGVAIDWVTGRSYSSARRRLNVQSGQRKGGKCAAVPA